LAHYQDTRKQTIKTTFSQNQKRTSVNNFATPSLCNNIVTCGTEYKHKQLVCLGDVFIDLHFGLNDNTFHKTVVSLLTLCKNEGQTCLSCINSFVESLLKVKV